MSDDKDRHQDLKAGEEDRSKINLITFDWSGTISDDRLPVYLTNRTLVLKYGGEFSFDFDQWLPVAGATTVDFLKRQGVDYESKEQVERDFDHYFNLFCDMGFEPEVYSDASQALADLKKEGKTLAVLSAHPDHNLKEEVADYGLDDLFTYIVGSCHNKVKGLERACECLNEGNSSVLYVGDTVRDIRSAREAGLLTSAVATGYGPRQKLAEKEPDFLAESLTDLKQQLQAYEKAH